MPSVFNPFMGQMLKADAGKPVKRGFLAHMQVSANEAEAADADGIATLPLAAAASTVKTGFTNPKWPRALEVKASKAGITSKVIIKGFNGAGAPISEEFTLNGTTAVAGIKAFARVREVELPAQTNMAAKQTETLTVSEGATSEGTVTVTLTAAGIAGSPVAVTVELESTDTTTALVAAKIAAALNANTAIAAKYAATAAEGVVTLTALDYAANDSTLAFAFEDTDSTSAAASGANGTTGVAADEVLIGWGDKLGLPYKLTHNTVIATYVGGTLEATAPTVTTDAAALEKNTIDTNTALNGAAVDVYIIV